MYTICIVNLSTLVLSKTSSVPKSVFDGLQSLLQPKQIAAETTRKDEMHPIAAIINLVTCEWPVAKCVEGWSAKWLGIPTVSKFEYFECLNMLEILG